MAAIVWPRGVLNPVNPMFSIQPRTTSAGVSVSGQTQVVASDAGIWRIVLADIILPGKSQAAHNCWRALEALLDGMSTPIMVPYCRSYQPAIDGAKTYSVYDQVPHSDDALFSDGSGYVGAANFVTAAVEAPVGSMTVIMAQDWGGTIEAGQVFSHGERMYRIASVTALEDGTISAAVRPQLREQIDAGDWLEFDRPAVRCRLAGDDEMAITMSVLSSTTASVAFVEDW